MSQNEPKLPKDIFRRAYRREPGAECPSPDLLAAFLERTLDGEERSWLEEHLAGCDRCLSTLAVAGFHPRQEASRPGISRFRRRDALAGVAIAAAAAVIFLVATVLWLGPVSGDEEPAVSPSEAVALLANRHPKLFGDLRVPDREELLAVRPPVTRGADLELLGPAGRTASPTPSFLWKSPYPEASHELRLFDASGHPLWRRICREIPCDFPADAARLGPGSRYLWEVETAGALGPLIARKAFRVATPEEREELDRALTAVAEEVDEPLASLVAAHVALERGFLDSARSHAEDYLAGRPEDPLGRATLYNVLARQGDAQAARVLAGQDRTP